MPENIPDQNQAEQDRLARLETLRGQTETDSEQDGLLLLKTAELMLTGQAFNTKLDRRELFLGGLSYQFRKLPGQHELFILVHKTGSHPNADDWYEKTRAERENRGVEAISQADLELTGVRQAILLTNRNQKLPQPAVYELSVFEGSGLSIYEVSHSQESQNRVSFSGEGINPDNKTQKLHLLSDNLYKAFNLYMRKRRISSLTTSG